MVDETDACRNCRPSDSFNLLNYIQTNNYVMPITFTQMKIVTQPVKNLRTSYSDV